MHVKRTPAAPLRDAEELRRRLRTTRNPGDAATRSVGSDPVTDQPLDEQLALDEATLRRLLEAGRSLVALLDLEPILENLLASPRS